MLDVITGTKRVSPTSLSTGPNMRSGFTGVSFDPGALKGLGQMDALWSTS